MATKSSLNITSINHPLIPFLENYKGKAFGGIVNMTDHATNKKTAVIPKKS
jgi:hypothetical protein